MIEGPFSRESTSTARATSVIQYLEAVKSEPRQFIALCRDKKRKKRDFLRTKRVRRGKTRSGEPSTGVARLR